MSTNHRNFVDALVLFGGLGIVLIALGLFLAFPQYQLLDTSVVRRPVWDPPRVVVREPLQGLTPEDVERMERDPRQREFLEKLRQPIVFEPQPSWLGREPSDPNRPPRGRAYPPNRLLYVLVGTVALYVFALKYRGIL